MIYLENIPSVMDKKIGEGFEAWEFRCRCLKCRMTMIHPYGLHLLVVLRALYGMTISFNSAYRCQEHNRNESGADMSYHPRGMAWDIDFPEEEKDRLRLIKLCRIVFPYTYVGEGFIHCDIRGFETRI